jgi:hypothetical protein
MMDSGKLFQEVDMRLNMAAVALVAGFATLLGSSAKAHIPFIEPEAREDAPESLPAGERAEMDYSFDNPFPLAEDLAFQDLHDFAFDGIDSMAINAYLTPGDIDVYKVVPAANDGFTLFSAAILASVLPPACAELLDEYPVVAAVGPGLPRDPSTLSALPFNIDDAAEVPQPASGMKNGAIFAPNPTVDRREIFVEDVVTGLSWFLPDGLTQVCLEPPSIPIDACDTFENTILAYEGQDDIVVGEPYYIAVWDPEGDAQDYTMTLGITDAHYVDRLDINAEIECFNLIHGDCTPPYEDLPEGYINELCEKSTGETGSTSSSSGCSIRSSSGGSTPVLAVMWLLGVMLLRRRSQRGC